MNKILCIGAILAVSSLVCSAEQPSDHLIFAGDVSKPGGNKHVVLIAGDQEYRSEEAMPMLAQILVKHGFKCTVLFSMDRENKFVDPNNGRSLSNAESLDSADAIILGLRFRLWEDESMQKFMDCFKRGTPIVALRATTHAFHYKKDSKWAKWSWRNSEGKFKGGFGRQVIGETWAGHWGKHAQQGTRTIIDENSGKGHPVLNGVGSIFCRSDVYKAKPLAPTTVLLRGQITESLNEDSKVTTDRKSTMLQPVAWVREYKHESGKVNRIFATTMGAADDLTDENLRRLLINGVYWGLELKVPEKAEAKLQSVYEPTMYGFFDHEDGVRKGFRKNKTPTDLLNVKIK